MTVIEQIAYSYLMVGVVFSVELLLTTTLFSLQLRRRSLFPLRLAGVLVSYFLICFFTSGIFLPVASDSPTFPLVQFLYFTIIWLSTILALTFLFSEPRKTILMVAIISYALQHIGYCLAILVRTAISDGDLPIPYNLLLEAAFLILSMTIVYLWLLKIGGLRTIANQSSNITKRRQQYRLREDWTIANQSSNITKHLAISFFMLVSCILLSAYGEWICLQNDLDILEYVIRPYGILNSVMIFIVLFGFFQQDKAKYENQMLELLLHVEKDQHRMQKQSVEIINMKCHDLKHQIQVLKEIDDPKVRLEAINEVEKAIDIYDSSISTGNDSLDIVLSERLLICRRRGIDFTFQADGKCLDFLPSTEVVSLMSNILDNAIHAVEDLPTEKRWISLKIQKKSGSIFLHAENPFQGEITFQNGLPKTTQKDTKYHGIGTKSIRYITQRHKGILNMYAEDHVFIVDICFLNPGD